MLNRSMTFRVLAALLVLFSLACLFGGCNTVEGAGQDIEEAGEAIEDAGDEE